ncbi:SMODS domain-containing nucleotidyltransferase [Cellulomonas wangsupingiae]|uniref:Nucleotidyltransferase n=1 Tax=Cellulomonas wangsupingiae TaxID=2968085 RepID=A0ABY5K737_9CELL|nr:nucleotidyltransferase [Cellulomonas wangsupingiae]MCC2335103.1 nucleotidyltransferase [Cellulomonas wangsupingiae]UUI65598.1 nucleotidyltransferase [Cellulomonas wangsupingiae]
MEQVKHFDTLLRDTVNLPQWRLDQLDDRVETIFGVLRSDAEVGALVTGKTKQGSWAHRMIIKPPKAQEYDADVLIHMTANPDWESDKGRYISSLKRALERSGYQGKVTMKTRCVRVQYANECHVDLVPYVDTPWGQRIVNRQTGEWEDSDPAGYTAWMKKRDEITHSNFRRSVRLLKYLRDHKNSFTGTPSIILTTLLGNQADSLKEFVQPGAYKNVPVTLVALMESLDDWLQARPLMPDVVDPSSPQTTFNHRWSQNSYSFFRARIHAHAAQMRDSLDEPDAEESTRKWRALFGDGFGFATTTTASASPFVVAGAAPSNGRVGRAG